MSSYKQDRVAEDIRREIAAIIRELKDPRVSGHIISVARAEVASDLSYVKVYVSAIEGLDTAKEAVKALKGASGLVRHEVGKRLSLRKTPEIKFVADDSIEHGMEIARKLEDLTGSERSDPHED